MQINIKNLNRKKLFIIFLLSFFLMSSGVALAYSIKFKTDGDMEYKNQNYKQSLTKYELSQKYWFPERISYELRDRDLHAKIRKAKIMVESEENYEKGTSAFIDKNYSEAKQYLSLIVAEGPHIQDAEEMLETIDKQFALSQKGSIETTEPSPLIGEKNIDTSISAIADNPVAAEESDPAPVSSYNDLHCPKIVKLEDSLGNVSSSGYLKGTFKKGSIDSLAIRVIATDPQNLPLYYQYGHTGLTDTNPTLVDWSVNNSIIIDVTNASAGSNRIITVGVDNQDEYGCSGSYVDTYGRFNYDITP